MMGIFKSEGAKKNYNYQRAKQYFFQPGLYGQKTHYFLHFFSVGRIGD